MRKKSSKLFNMVLAGACLLGCSQNTQEPTTPKYNPNARFVKTESVEGVKEVRIVGRTYAPGFNISKEVNISYGSRLFDENAHKHTIPVKISQSDRYFLHVEIDNKIYIKEVTKNMFRDIGYNTANAKYVEKRRATYKPGVELEKVADDFIDIEILSIEPKQVQ